MTESSLNLDEAKPSIYSKSSSKSKAKKSYTLGTSTIGNPNNLEIPDSTSSLSKLSNAKRRLSERLRDIPNRPSKVLTNAVEYVNKRRNEIHKLNKYNRKLHCFFIFMILALVCLIQNWGGWIQYFLINKSFTLAEGTMYFNAWNNSEQQITTNFYLFNITNPEEILSGKKPRLVEIGPYEYKILQKKVDVDPKMNNESANQNHPTISYQSELIYSNGKIDLKNIAIRDRVTHINLPMMELKSKLGFFQKSKVYSMKDESVFKTNTVYDWLWGFEELDLKNLSENTLGLVGDNLGLNSEFGMMQSLKPGTILSETEIYQGMNSEKSPTWNRQLQLASLAGKNDISCWENADLDSFENATEGLGVGPMFLKNSDKMQVYRSEFLHKVYYEKTKRKADGGG